MRTKQIAVIMVLSLFTVLAFGQTNTNSVPGSEPGNLTGGGLILILIPLVVPLLVALTKYLIQWLPKWSIPMIAAGLGELLNFLSGLAGGPTTSAINGVLLGAAGTWVREAVTQLQKRISPPA